MLGWLKSILTPQPNATHYVGGADLDEGFEPVREASDEEIAAIEETLKVLLSVGIELGPMYRDMSLRDVAEEIASCCEALDHLNQPIEKCSLAERVEFLLCQMRDGPDYEGFNNAIYIPDHCFDGADENTYNQLVRRIISLAGDKWHVDSVSARGVDNAGKPLYEAGVVEITLTTAEQSSAFELFNDKDFDWTLIDKLNARLPQDAKGRFALLLYDQTAIVVYLPIERIEQLNRIHLCEDGFVSTLGEDYYRMRGWR